MRVIGANRRRYVVQIERAVGLIAYCMRMHATQCCRPTLFRAENMGIVAQNHLIAAATFGVGVSGIAVIEAIALMLVSERWIPFESQYEGMLLEALAERGVIFAKGLRYNLPPTQPMASVVLSRDGGEPIAMYIVPDDADGEYRGTLELLVSESEMPSWIWEIADGPMPDIPL